MGIRNYFGALKTCLMSANNIGAHHLPFVSEYSPKEVEDGLGSLVDAGFGGLAATSLSVQAAFQQPITSKALSVAVVFDSGGHVRGNEPVELRPLLQRFDVGSTLSARMFCRGERHGFCDSVVSLRLLFQQSAIGGSAALHPVGRDDCVSRYESWQL